jgi:hypothetical protein
MVVSSEGLRLKSDCSGKAQKQLYSKLQICPLVREHLNLTFQCTNMCTLATSTFSLVSVHKSVYFGHFNISFQCTNMCTLATSTLPFCARICVLRPLKPFLSVHKYVYFGYFNLTFQCTNMCISAT